MVTTLRQRSPHVRLIAMLDDTPTFTAADLIAANLHGALFRYEFSEALLAELRVVAMGSRWFSGGVLAWVHQSTFTPNPITIPSTKPLGKLSRREWQVFTMIAEGKANKDIAQALHISVNTLEHHISKLYLKLDVTNRTNAVKLYWVEFERQKNSGFPP